MIIVYFSQSGTTAQAANELHKLTQAAIYRLEPVKAYPSDFSTLADRAKSEVEQDIHPQLQDQKLDLSGETKIMLGFPTWWHQAPMIIASFFDNYDLKDKEILPFTTSGQSSIKESLPSVKKWAIATGAHVGAALTANATAAITKFVNENDL
ncbi:MAG: flavodoxin [Oenococcus sp.]|uniref:flavodoxin n=1 Tax=Oenococcus sp. TaxID=1979414 RepID=UPI0039E955D8